MGEWQQLVRLMDPERSGFISPDQIVPLMFWLGLSRRRANARVVLELAMGPGPIAVESFFNLCSFLDVQVRLVEGLRKVARRESLEQLCEFLTENDLLRVRTWFHSMKRSPEGRVDVVEVQNFFAREGVTSDRQALFRFLSHVARSNVLPGFVAPGSESIDKEKAGTQGKQPFGIEHFASIIARCTVVWCLHKTLTLMMEEAVPLSPVAEPTDLALQWSQLQRKIVVSLLINHRFWGQASKTVLASWEPPGGASFGEELSTEQWRSLFERVRAQGMRAILPVGDEVDDPDFLIGKTRHPDIPIRSD